MAVLIDADGTQQTIHPQNLKFGFTIEEIYRLIGCVTVQVIRIGEDGSQMWMDEDGKYRPELKPNRRATSLLHKVGGEPGDVIFGTVLITRSGEIK